MEFAYQRQSPILQVPYVLGKRGSMVHLVAWNEENKYMVRWVLRNV